MKLIDHLNKSKSPADVQVAIMVIAEASKKIYQVLKKQKISYAKSINSSGEMQLSHDILADEIIAESLRDSHVVSCMVSEEKDNELCFIDHTPDKLLVAYDPIDGSSVAGAGLAVGTAAGIYRGVDEFLDATGRNQVASLYVLYGSRMVLVYTCGEGVHIFSYDEDDDIFNLEQEHVTLSDMVKVCGFGDMQHSCNIPGFHELITHWEKEGFKLRYSGSMTADVNGILKIGGGIFAYPGAKLRMLYECNPFAYMIEQAGGKAVNIKGQDILDLHIHKIDQESSVLMGATAQVEKALEFFNGDFPIGCELS